MYICKVCVFLAVTCHLDWVEQLLKEESAQKVDPGEEHSSAAPAGIQTHDL